MGRSFVKGDMMETILRRIANPTVFRKEETAHRAGRPSRKRFAIAFGVAALSDVLSLWTEFVPPVQWALDLATAFLLFLILGRRWAILPGLIAEAIPGMGVFPVWIFVVLSIIFSTTFGATETTPRVLAN
jgi:hypothetical protein